MRTFFKAVAVGALALGFSACSQDTMGPDLGPQFGVAAGHLQRDTTTVSSEAPGNLSTCAWDALRRADSQLEKGSCKK